MNDNDRKKLCSDTTVCNYNIRNIQKYELNHHIGDNKYESYIEPDFLNQGIFINALKKDIYQVKITLTKSNEDMTALDYNLDLVNIYGEELNNFTYFGFNVNENLKSTNLIGCLNLSTVDKVKVSVIINDDNKTLDIYMPNWNVLTYNQGLCGIRYTK